ncbi:MAG: DUF2782 domain-containing protein [Gammaproteobacteria bacterium]|nr:DUF2782 domain-containing protein [Gammaproteobacteria bacterium]NNJ72524.1 DUF2782 domain-containing protein [Enterobacterales bacterium]
MCNRILIIMALSFLTTGFFAAENKTKTKKPVQEAPKVQRGYVPKAEITIVEGEDTLVKEYRINGQLRAIKVTPKSGFPPYYLIDRQGTGEFVKLGPDMGEEMTVPNWILIEW